jgi:murein L,D-transpeptidase YcbB/YkuD
MSVSRTLRAVGAAIVGMVNARGSAVPPADPRAVRALLVEIGMLDPLATEAETARTLRRFQARAGLAVDGVAGPRTAQALARYAREARHMRELRLAA